MANPFTPEQISQILEEFFKVVGTRQYIGARYVPIFGRKDEESIEWDNSAPYEPLTIVLYQGNSYTSRQYVPVGVEITNQEFWALTGNYNAQVEKYRQEVQALDGRIDANAQAISTEETNRVSAVTEEKTRAENAEHTLQTNIDNEKTRAEDAEHTLQTNIDNEKTRAEDAETTLNKKLHYVTPEEYGAVGDGITDDTNAIQLAFDSGACVVFGSKTYLVSRNMTVSKMQEIRGMGSNTRITSNSNVFIYINNDSKTSDAFPMGSVGTSIHDIYFHNVTLSFGTESDTQVLYSVHVYNCTWILGNMWPIILQHKCAFLTFTNCFAQNTNGFVYLDGVSQAVVSSGSTNTFVGCVSSNSWIASVYMDGTGADGFSPAFINCSFEHAPYSFYAAGTIPSRADITFISLHCEKNSKGCINTSEASGGPIYIHMFNPWIYLEKTTNAVFSLAANTTVKYYGGFVHQSANTLLSDGDGTLCISNNSYDTWANRKAGKIVADSLNVDTKVVVSPNVNQALVPTNCTNSHTIAYTKITSPNASQDALIGVRLDNTLIGNIAIPPSHIFTLIIEIYVFDSIVIGSIKMIEANGTVSNNYNFCNAATNNQSLYIISTMTESFDVNVHID